MSSPTDPSDASVRRPAIDDEGDASRFEFGGNWQSFLDTIDEPRIESATESLRSMLGCDDLYGRRMLDIGCGSGLFSLAAWRLGADVTSIDYDPQCVACAGELRTRYAGGADASRWRIARGSVLDAAPLRALGQFDIVYSWGVLHHTGDLWRAIELAAGRVAVGGRFFISIYNDQGSGSRLWLKIKRTYARLPVWARPAWVAAVAGYYESKFAIVRLIQRKNPLPLAEWKAKKRDRGMSVWHDWVDWVGGLPFEVSTPDQVINTLRTRGFVLDRLQTVGSGWGCNQFVFTRLEGSR